MVEISIQHCHSSRWHWSNIFMGLPKAGDESVHAVGCFDYDAQLEVL